VGTGGEGEPEGSTNLTIGGVANGVLETADDVLAVMLFLLGGVDAHHLLASRLPSPSRHRRASCLTGFRRCRRPPTITTTGGTLSQLVREASRQQQMWWSPPASS
jgi:hypothetical protein